MSMCTVHVPLATPFLLIYLQTQRQRAVWLCACEDDLDAGIKKLSASGYLPTALICVESFLCEVYLHVSCDEEGRIL